jgi:hypothetical protein
MIPIRHVKIATQRVARRARMFIFISMNWWRGLSIVLIVREVRFHGMEAEEVADAMIQALWLTLLATSASLDHP